MKTNKINRLKISAICASIALAICAVVAWSLVASNAFATNDEATTPTEEATPQAEAAEEPAKNEPITFKFHFNLQDSCPTPSYELKKNDVPVPFEITTDNITFTDAEKVNVRLTNQGSLTNIALYPEPTGQPAYVLQVFSPLKFKCTSTNLEEEVTSGTKDYELSFGEYDGKYKIEIEASQKSGGKAANYNFYLTTTDTTVLAQATTGPDGKTTINDVEPEWFTYQLVGEGTAHADDFMDLNQADIHGDYTANLVFTLDPISSADLKLKSTSEHHEYFIYHYKQTNRSTGEVVSDSTITKKYWTLYSQGIVAGDFDIDANGIATHKAKYGPFDFEITLAPVSEEGYPLQYWEVDLGNNETQRVYPNSSFTVPAGSKVSANVVYSDTPTPGPTPTPSEETQANAQTGDTNNAVIPLAIIAAVCATALIARRRINQN